MSRSDVIQEAGERGDLLPSTVDNLEVWITGDFLPDWASDSIGELIENEEWTELNNRFYQNLKFGTGGMRGRTIGEVVAPTERGSAAEGDAPQFPAVGSNNLNDFNVIRASLGLYRYTERYLREETERFDLPRLVIAHDVRHFSRHFCELAASTWTRAGGQAFIFEGPRSTPQLSFSVRHLQAHAGVVITASHNPPHDNGFKAYFQDGGQVVSPHAEGIVEEVQSIALNELPTFFEKNLEKVIVLREALDAAYAEALRENILDETVFQDAPPKVVFTPIHGTGGVQCVPLLKELGIEVLEVEPQDQMDGVFPTVKSPNPENAEALDLGMQKAEETQADVVLGTDPDADRMGLAVRDASGQLVLLSGNQIGSVLAEYRIQSLKDGGILPEEGTENAALIKTFVTTPLQAAIAEAHGLKVIDTLTGFKFIGEKLNDYQRQMETKLREEEGLALHYDQTALWTRAELQLEYSTFYVLGGEESYGYLGNDRVRDKDANAAVLMICELIAYLKTQEMTLPEYLDSLYLEYGYYAERLVNIYYEGAAGSQKIKNILESYRNNPPDILNGQEIARFTDFGKEEIRDADGKVIPKQDFYVLEFADGYRYAVRGSGTEPKIKFYCFGRESVDEEGNLESVKEQTEEKLKALAEAIEADARQRAEG